MRHSRHHFETPPPEKSSRLVSTLVQTAELVLIMTAIYISYVTVLPWVKP
jgi:hypothetical protein